MADGVYQWPDLRVFCALGTQVAVDDCHRSLPYAGLFQLLTTDAPQDTSGW